MSKPTTPLLSFEAHGTVGKAITYQGRGLKKVVRSKPRLPYSLTLPQQYQRWLYEDYSYLWRQQSVDTQAEYRSAGVRFHLTAYQYWMKYQLANLPDINAWWKMDDNQSAALIDSSRNGNSAVNFGASPSAGFIGNALYWDGSNDRLLAPDSPSLNTKAGEDFTLEALIKAPAGITYRRIFSKEGAVPDEMLFRIRSNGKLQIHLESGGASEGAVSTFRVDDDAVHHVLAKREGLVLYLYIDGLYNTQGVSAGGSYANALDVFIGARDAIGEWYKGIIDNLIYLNRALDETEILRHSLRRFPA